MVYRFLYGSEWFEEFVKIVFFFQCACPVFLPKPKCWQMQEVSFICLYELISRGGMQEILLTAFSLSAVIQIILF